MEGVEELLWDDHNLDHIARHDARPAEANSVVFGPRPVLVVISNERRLGRREFYGTNEAGRYLVVVTDAPTSTGLAYIVTTRPMSERERVEHSRREWRAMSEHDPIADGRDWYAETDLSRHIASGKVVRALRVREGEPMSTFALRISDGVLGDVADVASARGVPTSTLMRQWIVERLALEQRRPADSTGAIWQAALDAVPRLAEDIAGQLAGRRST